MSASKAVLSFSQSIVVDTSETAALPALVKDAYLRGGASIPIVIITDPGVKNIYGTFNHPAMKSQKYNDIFKPAKEKIAKAHKDGSFAKDGNTKPAAIIKIPNGKMESWKSIQGTEFKARLLGIEGEDTFVFETEKKKTIRGKAKHLAPESVKRVREAAKKAAEKK